MHPILSTNTSYLLAGQGELVLGIAVLRGWESSGPGGVLSFRMFRR